MYINIYICMYVCVCVFCFLFWVMSSYYAMLATCLLPVVFGPFNFQHKEPRPPIIMFYYVEDHGT